MRFHVRISCPIGGVVVEPIYDHRLLPSRQRRAARPAIRQRQPLRLPPLPHRVAHPRVLAVSDRLLGFVPGPRARTRLGPHLHDLGDEHDEHRALARGLLAVLHLALKRKLIQQSQAPDDASLLHRLPRRRLLRGLVRLPAALGENERVVVLVRHHQHLPGARLGATRGNRTRHEADLRIRLAREPLALAPGSGDQRRGDRR
mmetsp:Transcript_3517/g.14850  ORF Transcript_3517/g.14850 Transcript_3517/m.14850 type:complete len:202 (+) Transcript_3517:62-667(+)